MLWQILVLVQIIQMFYVVMFHPFTGHEGPQGEYRYSSTLFQTSALEGGEGSASRPGHTLPPGKTRYPLYRRLGGPQGRSGLVRKISPHRDSIPGPSSPQAVSIPTELPGPKIFYVPCLLIEIISRKFRTREHSGAILAHSLCYCLSGLSPSLLKFDTQL